MGMYVVLNAGAVVWDGGMQHTICKTTYTFAAPVKLHPFFSTTIPTLFSFTLVLLCVTIPTYLHVLFVQSSTSVHEQRDKILLQSLYNEYCHAE